GLLSECLEHELKNALPNEEIITLDIDGKDDFPAASSPAEGRKSKWMKSVIPSFLLNNIRNIKNINRTKKRLLEKVDFNNPGEIRFIIGGGHLITASSSYFPVRLYVLGQIAKRFNVSMYIYAVGVSHSKSWISSAKKILLEALVDNKKIKFVSTRDKLSGEYWKNSLAAAINPVICRDPGLLVADLYPRKQWITSVPESKENKKVGIGVINQKIINDVSRHKNIEETVGTSFFISIANNLISAGFKPVFFTNGDVDDEVLMSHIKLIVKKNNQLALKVEFSERPRSPETLCKIISKLDGVIAHRMHANIAAYSYRIPHVGLGWDVKLKSFFNSVQRDDFFIYQESASPEKIVECMIAAMDVGIDIDQHAEVLKDARAGVRLLSKQL
ncbi:polysaccharide pyruvyl transferase family protein, partial [Actimicrobium sp. CCI2.3]|uniref:polysaccharide pyruvyl transferase family protein n=1 Tax=Actimicrobium sp. CCI2.3 TaxID=3048616 RepID=UPI002B24F46B